MSYQIRGGEHHLFAGTVRVASFASVEAMHAFVAGIAVHQAAVPDKIVQQIREFFAESVHLRFGRTPLSPSG